MSALASGVLISQKITHEERLASAEAETFVLRMAELGDGLGPLLVGLPPSSAGSASGGSSASTFARILEIRRGEK